MSSNYKSIDARFMEELKQKNDIVDVISGYASLDRKGNTHWACCPFHHERTPSFAVNQGEQFYHCFGCGVSGDVVKFVKEIENTDFIGAVRILASRAKMEVPENNFRKRLFEDIEYVEQRLERIRECFDMTDEPELVDALIYEELALKARYAYLLRIAKENNIRCKISISQ